MNKKDAQMSQQELEDIHKEADAISVYDIQELSDDLGIEPEIDLHNDDLPQGVIDKEHRRLMKLKEELELIPEEERKYVDEEKKERDDRPIAKRVGRVRKQVDHGAVVSAITNNKQIKKNKAQDKVNAQANGSQVNPLDVIIAGLQLQQQVVNPIPNDYVADQILNVPNNPIDELLKVKKEKVKPEKRIQPKRKAKK
jgi:hypothetical protein